MFERIPTVWHVFATHAILSGVDIKTLTGMLWHYSAGVTLNTYTHITHQMQHGAAEKIGGFMAGVRAEAPPPEPDPTAVGSGCKVIEFQQAI